jgi:hypothetical protein
MEGILAAVCVIVVTLAWLWYLPSILYLFRRTRLARKYELYQLEKRRLDLTPYSDHDTCESVRQGKVDLRGEVNAIPTELGLSLPFIIKEEEVFIRRTAFIQAKDKLITEINELAKKKTNTETERLRILFDILTVMYDFRAEWEVLRPSEFKEMYLELTSSTNLNVTREERRAVIKFFDTAYKYW